jgi:hypothetical protein
VQIDVTKEFKYASNGYEVVEYTAGSSVDVPEECGTVAIKEGWAKLSKRSSASAKAPENAAAVQAPETK